MNCEGCKFDIVSDDEILEAERYCCRCRRSNPDAKRDLFTGEEVVEESKLAAFLGTVTGIVIWMIIIYVLVTNGVLEKLASV